MDTLNQVLLNPAIRVGADLTAWLGQRGGTGLRNALADRPAIVATIEAADLRGMGGTGFPTHRKWRLLDDTDRDGDRYLICNGHEDGPGPSKDRLLLEETPHQVIEGALIAALANDLNHIIFYLNPRASRAVAATHQAVEQWKTNPLFRPLLRQVRAAVGRSLTLRVFCSSGLYIGGEETAAIAAIEGGFPFPRRQPPSPAHEGLHGRPTLIHNVETLAQVGHILRHGAPWYLDLGIGPASGTKLYALDGDILNPGVYELPMGTSLRELIDVHGGGLLPGREFKAAFAGGPANTLLAREDLDVPLDWDSLQARQARLGTGAMVVVAEGTGIVKRVAECVDFLADASCGQCPSCKIGVRRLSNVLRDIEAGRTTRHTLDHLVNLCQMLPGSGRCGLVDDAVRVVESSLCKFPTEYRAHLPL